MARISIRSGIIGVALSLCLLGLTGCGPISATHAIAEATVAVEAASGVEAKRYAAYEFTLAYEYLRKAMVKDAKALKAINFPTEEEEKKKMKRKGK